MTTPPHFASTRDYVLHLEDLGFWQPYIAEILKRHGLSVPGEEAVSGTGGTFPTYIYGDIVVKLFGRLPSWRGGHVAERAAQNLLATDSAIAAPRLLGEGRLFDDPADPWPYLITTRMPGVSLESTTEVTAEQRLEIARELGRQVRRVHDLSPSGIVSDLDLPALDVTAACARSSLPAHLVAQVETYLHELRPFDRVVVHGDLTARHTFLDGGRFAGIIDWGDTMVTDRHYELCQVHRDVFRCDKTLLRAFLDAGEWPVEKDFARQAMGLALHRQARGVAQHHTMDVFEPVAALLPLQDIATLGDLAAELFGV
ncbi:phosphotransferase family protein [Streptomyces sp. Ncost-T10-10d]|uniref:phosphotransferase family protein n=1 Tax=Streptomyces sp. Ncost-T10-10d TaxID=1839774 RepID=UPI00081DE61A|nr:phosphotransferase [Streptomyces sp. Ncost-T10-10d]SCF82047.1 Phosphotransferase enzyme family protein [Streptomyces sp. Ncost-T10-10d]